MNTKAIIGSILIIVGAVILVGQGIRYTTKEKAVNLGPIEVTTEKQRYVPPVVGVIALVSGGLLLFGSGLSKKLSLR